MKKSKLWMMHCFAMITIATSFYLISCKAANSKVKNTSSNLQTDTFYALIISLMKVKIVLLVEKNNLIK